MRDPERLDEFYKRLKNIHKMYFSDLRFIQFLTSINSFIENTYSKDPFYIEEDEYLNYARHFKETMIKNK